MFNFSLPVVEGFNMKPLSHTKMYFVDPKSRLTKPTGIVQRHYIFGETKTDKRTADGFSVAKTKELNPIKATFFPRNKAFDNLNKDAFFQPIPVMVQKPPRQETLTNSQVSLLSGVSDPTQKFFLLQMFRDKIDSLEILK